jgi:hypothetical protein
MHSAGNLHFRERIIKIPHRIALRIDLTLSISVTHELETVLRLVRNLVILIADILQHLEEVQPASRVNGGDWPVSLLVLEPRRTRRRPGKSLHQLVRVVLQFANGVLLRLVRLDVLGLQLPDHLEHVPRVPFQDRKE